MLLIHISGPDTFFFFLRACKPFVTSNKGRRDSSKGSNVGMDMDNDMGSMGRCNNMVQGGVADGIG
jgi:hypothetical protein